VDLDRRQFLAGAATVAGPAAAGVAAGAGPAAARTGENGRPGLQPA
jgi:phosphodiesterase/alkaline phosphatase D-like protein